MLGFSRNAAEHRSQWPWRRISLHVVDQHSDWPATESVECHIKFSKWKIPPVMQPLVRILWPLVYHFHYQKMYVGTVTVFSGCFWITYMKELDKTLILRATNTDITYWWYWEIWKFQCLGSGRRVSQSDTGALMDENRFGICVAARRLVLAKVLQIF